MDVVLAFLQAAPLTFIPTSDPSSAGPSVSLSSTANSFGIHDTLRQGGGRNLAAEVQVDTYEQRLKNVSPPIHGRRVAVEVWYRREPVGRGNHPTQLL